MMTLLLFVGAGIALGFVFASVIKEAKDAQTKKEVLGAAKEQLINMNKTRAKEKELAYHAGFEAGMEKAQSDLKAQIEALSLEVEKEAYENVNFNYDDLTVEPHTHGPECSHSTKTPKKKTSKKPSKKKPAVKPKKTTTRRKK